MREQPDNLNDDGGKRALEELKSLSSRFEAIEKAQGDLVNEIRSLKETFSRITACPKGGATEAQDIDRITPAAQTESMATDQKFAEQEAPKVPAKEHAHELVIPAEIKEKSTSEILEDLRRYTDEMVQRHRQSIKIWR